MSNETAECANDVRTRKWKTGDPVIIVPARRHSRYRDQTTHRGTVTKVARKYFTAQYETGASRPIEDQFEIATGLQRCDPNYTNYRDQAYTPAQWETHKLRQELLHRLNTDHRVRWGYSDSTLTERNLNTEDLTELLALLDRVKSKTAEL